MSRSRTTRPCWTIRRRGGPLRRFARIWGFPGRRSANPSGASRPRGWFTARSSTGPSSPRCSRSSPTSFPPRHRQTSQSQASPRAIRLRRSGDSSSRACRRCGRSLVRRQRGFQSSHYIPRSPEASLVPAIRGVMRFWVSSTPSAEGALARSPTVRKESNSFVDFRSPQGCSRDPPSAVEWQKQSARCLVRRPELRMPDDHRTTRRGRG